jgi:2-dehydropantoate 2-reductase
VAEAGKIGKYLLLGLGPAGSILGAHLAGAGFPVYGIDIRPDITEAIRRDGITLSGFTAIQSQLTQCCNSVDELETRDFDYVVIAVKTPFMASAVSMIEQLEGDFKVISLQNGLDNEEFLSRHFGKDRVLRIVVNYAGILHEPGHVEMTFFHKPNFVGCVCEEEGCMDGQLMATDLTVANLDTKSVDDIKRFTWRKTILNASLSPVSSVMGLTMAEVMNSKEGYQLVEMLLKECIAVAGAAGYDYGEGFYDHCLDYLARGGHHKPSMLIDLENHSPTEIDYINGMVDSYGYELNVPVPVNTVLTALVKARERSSSPQ